MNSSSTQQPRLRSNHGFSLLEVMIVVGILTIMIGAMMALFLQMTKTSNYAEFTSKREQLRLTILGQVLNDPKNCLCMFGGPINLPSSGFPVDELSVPEPSAIGKFNFPDPNSCAGANIPYPLITATGGDGIKLSSAKIKTVDVVNGSYRAELEIGMSSLKPVVGPSEIFLKIPIALSSELSGGNVVFKGCSLSGGTNTPVDYTPVLTGANWNSTVLGTTGGSGTSTDSLHLNLARIHSDYACGPLQVYTLNDPEVTPTTRAAIISFGGENQSEESGFFRVFTMNNYFAGAFGQASRGGDGEDHGVGGMLYVPLVNKQFKMQGCSDSGGSKSVYYSVMGVIN
jgi:prepilin-type N-terminal cleavage/methylation domain-containing protein